MIYTRFLCVCDGGNVRSHAMAVALKEKGHDAVAIGRFSSSPETMSMMCEWAEKVVIMEPHMKESIPEEFHNKLHIVDVGFDRYGVGINPELRKQVEEGRFYMLQSMGIQT